MILDLGASTTELIRVTAEYSNAVLVAVLPYISHVAQNLDLPVQHPVTAQNVVYCSVLPNRRVEAEIAIKGGWVFAFSHGHIRTIQSGHAYSILQDPDKIPQFFGPVNISSAEAVQCARDALKKLEIRPELVFAEQQPQVSGPHKMGTNTVPHYQVVWPDPRGGPSVEAEVNGTTRRIERLCLRNKALERPPPELTVTPPRDPAGMAWPQVNPEYARRLLPIALCAVDEYGKQLSLGFRRPLTTNDVARFSVADNGGWALKSDEEAAVFAKVMQAGKPLGQYVDGRLHYGIKTGLNEAFIIDATTRRTLIQKDRRSEDLIKPLLGGEDIRRYIYHETGLWLIFTRRGVDIDKYPAIREHLAKWKEDLTPKRDKGAKRGRKPGRYQWYEIQDDVAYYEAFDAPKLIFPDIAKDPRFCLDTGGHYLANTAYAVGTDDPYLLGILNSRLFWFAISNISIPFGIRAGKYRYRLIYQYMEKVPIRPINPDNAADMTRRDAIAQLAEQMLTLHQRHAAAKTPQEKTTIERQIAATDSQLDTLIYALYGLADAEIKIVEASTA